MGFYIQILSLVIAGIILLWFGYSLFFGPLSLLWGWRKKDLPKGQPGEPQVCPICSIKLIKGELVKTLAFPSISGGRDRLMYIRGCNSCIEGGLPRKCPICGMNLTVNDYLVSRMFERPFTKNHVHVLGCNYCRRMGSLDR